MKYQLVIAFAFTPASQRISFSGVAVPSGAGAETCYNFLVTAQVGQPLQSLDESQTLVRMQPLASVGWGAVFVKGDPTELEHAPGRAKQAREFLLAPQWDHDLKAPDALERTAEPLKALAVHHRVPADKLEWHYILREMDGSPPPPSISEVHTRAVACVGEHVARHSDILPQEASKHGARFS